MNGDILLKVCEEKIIGMNKWPKVEETESPDEAVIQQVVEHRNAFLANQLKSKEEKYAAKFIFFMCLSTK